MLILVVVTVTVALNGGLFNAAKKATSDTEIAREAESELSNGQVNINNTIYNSIEEYLTGHKSEENLEGILKVTLKVDEANVTGTEIPVEVEKVTKGEEDTQIVDGNLTYEWYYDESNKSTDENKHEFDKLSPDQSYTLKCKVSDNSGNWGIGEVTVIWFKVEDTYFRATNGMTWEDWCDSSYSKSMPKSQSIVDNVSTDIKCSLFNSWSCQAYPEFGWVISGSYCPDSFNEDEYYVCLCFDEGTTLSTKIIESNVYHFVSWEYYM